MESSNCVLRACSRRPPLRVAEGANKSKSLLLFDALLAEEVERVPSYDTLVYEGVLEDNERVRVLRRGVVYGESELLFFRFLQESNSFNLSIKSSLSCLICLELTSDRYSLSDMRNNCKQKPQSFEIQSL